MRGYRFLLCIGVICATQGCSEVTALWEDRYGPAPVPSASAIQQATQRQLDVMKELALGAGYLWPPPPPSRAQEYYWYNLTLVGFNVIDEQCTQYMSDLYGWDRKRNRAKDILTLGASTAATVLGITNAGQKALVLTAQAFGFTSGAWTIFADSYLYKIDPATINSIVAKLQGQYRTVAADNKDTIKLNGATAYQYLRGYLNLCLPVSIEYSVVEYLAASAGTQKPTGDGSGTPPANVLAFPRSRASAAATPRVGLRQQQ